MPMMNINIVELVMTRLVVIPITIIMLFQLLMVMTDGLVVHLMSNEIVMNLWLLVVLLVMMLLSCVILKNQSMAVMFFGFRVNKLNEVWRKFKLHKMQRYMVKLKLSFSYNKSDTPP